MTFWAAIITALGALLGRIFSALIAGIPFGLIFAPFGIPIWAADWVGAFFSSLPVYYGAMAGLRIFNKNGGFRGNRKAVALFAALVIIFSAAGFAVLQLSLAPERTNWNYIVANAILPTIAAYFGSLSGTRVKKREVSLAFEEGNR